MKRTETFQNLLLITLADGVLDEREKLFVDQISYELGITDEEYTDAIQSIATKDFIIPSSREEGYNELYKMTLLCLSDGEIAEEELSELHHFATECGFTDEEFQKIIGYVVSQYNSQHEITIKENKELYNEVVRILKSEGKPDTEIAKRIAEVTRSKNIDMVYSADNEVNKAFYCLLWLIYCRYIKLHEVGVVMNVVYLSMMETGNYTLDDYLIDLKLAEEVDFDGIKLMLFDTSLELIKLDLRKSFIFTGVK